MFKRLFRRTRPEPAPAPAPAPAPSQESAAAAPESAAAPPAPAPVTENINEIFFTAVKKNNIKKVKKMIGTVDINMTNPTDNNATPLIYAAVKDYPNMVKLLLDAGANINKQASNGNTALILASDRGHLEIVDILISNRADPNIRNSNNLPAIAYAIRNNGKMYFNMYILKPLVIGGTHLNSPYGKGETPLIDAIIKKKIDIIKFLLDAGADINARSLTNLRITPLIEAVYTDNINIIKLLIERGADKNLVDIDGSTALMHAAAKNKIDAAKLLITSGASLNIKGHTGSTALIIAVFKNNNEMVKLLIDSGVDLNISDNKGNTALIHAVKNDNIDIVKILIDSGADLNINDIPGNTALIHAVNNNKIDIVKLLITARANLDSENRSGLTALIIAVTKNYIDIVKLLIGADANIKDNVGDRALLYALANNNVELIRIIVTAINTQDINNTVIKDALIHMVATNNLEKTKLLIDLGANVNSKNKFGETPLIMALLRKNLRMIELLITLGANVNLVDNEGNTPLHRCASFHITDSNQIPTNINITNSLINAGADVNIKNKYGNTPLMLAISTMSHAYIKYTTIINFLIEHGADINTINNQGFTPLSIAISNNFVDAIKLLITAGADISKQAPDGTTALYIAAKGGSEELVNLLLARMPELTPKIQEAIKRKEFKPSIIKLLRVHYKLESANLWKGKSKGNIEMFDTIFANEASMSNYSFCPVCLSWVPRVDGCMYMNHDCTDMQYYNEELYDKYKNREGKISWCTICGRICAGHYHYPVVPADRPTPRPIVLGRSDPFEKDCRISNGGGGLPEKFARIRQFRETALRLQNEVGKMGHEEAMDTLVKECWNAALKATNENVKGKVQTIINTKKWNVINASNFPANVVQTKPAANIVANAPNANDPIKYSAPIVLSPGAGAAGTPDEGYEGNSVTFADDVPVIVFRHKDKEGNEQPHSQIGKDSLLRDIGDLGAERRGVCFECTGFLYPREIELAFADPKMAPTITEEDRAKLATYKRWFNKWRAEDAAAKGGRRRTRRKGNKSRVTKRRSTRRQGRK